MTAYSLLLLSEDPLIGVTYGGVQLEPAVRRMAQMAAGAAAHVLVRPTWEGRESFADIAAVVRGKVAEAPNLKMTVLNGTQSDDDHYRRAGLDSIWCSHNAFIDDRIFTPDPEAEPLYDAVYAGRLNPVKRHELAVAVPRLAVITHGHEVEAVYAQARIAAFQDLRFVNYSPDAGVDHLDPHAVRRIMTQARCGLALSAVEGPMYASAEYLLCGLPVVTTASRGGRDVFFHPDYVELVEDTPSAVAEGVARIIARRPDPKIIRRRTLERIRPHRARLLMWLSGLMQRDLFPLAGESLWLPSYVHKLENWFEA